MKFQILVFLVAVFIGSFAFADELQTCRHPIYCVGEIPKTIQEQSKQFLGIGCKSFVDRPLKLKVDQIQQNFNEFKTKTPSKANLEQFLNDNFYEVGIDVVTKEIPAAKWVETPTFLGQITDAKLKEMAATVHQTWKQLYREFSEDMTGSTCTSTSDSDACFTHIKTTNQNAFIIAGQRFREFYYWDSYWIIKGLLTSELSTIALDMIDNFSQLIDKYNAVLNGARIYYTSRSQPPLFIQMCQLYYDYLIKQGKAADGKAFLQKYFANMEKEYKFWQDQRSVTVTKAGNSDYILNQYNSKQTIPRPESLLEDIALANKFTTEAEKQKLYSELASGAESGLDYTSRWFSSIYDFSTIATTDIVPLDLNIILYKNEKTLSSFADVLTEPTKVTKYDNLATTRKIAIDAVFKNADNTYNDYNVKTNTLKTDFYLSNYISIWGFEDKLDQTSWQQIMKDVDTFLTYPGSIPSSKYETGQQWDYPNVWAPQISFLVEGLYKAGSNNNTLNTQYKLKEKAASLAEKWIFNVYCGYSDNQEYTKQFFEKYNAQLIGSPGGGGEYSVQTGFGWTNGFILELLGGIGKTWDISTKKCSISVNADYNYPKPSATADETLIAIIGTNDLHGQVLPVVRQVPNTEETYKVGGLLNMASVVKTLQKEFKDQYLWIDAGDQWTGTLINYESHGVAISKFYNGFQDFNKVDAMTTGNHDFDFSGIPEYIDFIKKYDFQYITANIYDKVTDKFVKWDPVKFVQAKTYTLKNDIKIGIIGLATITTPQESAADFSSVIFKAYHDLTISLAKKLREEENANAVLVLAHIGQYCLNGDAADILDSIEPKLRDSTQTKTTCDTDSELYQFLNKLPAGVIDGVIAGHQHTIVHNWINPGIPVMIAQSNAKDVNVMYLKFDKDKKLKNDEILIEGPIPVCDKVFENYKRCDMKPTAIDLTKTGNLIPYKFHGVKIGMDTNFYEVAKDYIDETNIKGRTVLGEVMNEMTNNWNDESQLGNFFCDSMKFQDPSRNIDIALSNDGMIRQNWPKGKLNYNLLFNTIPFQNKLSAVDMTGEEVLKTMFVLQKGSEAYYQVAGLEMKVLNKVTSNASQRQLLSLRLYDHSEIDLAKTYRVAMPDFMLDGGVDFHDVLKFYTPRNRGDYDTIRDILQKYVVSKKQLNTAADPIIQENHRRIKIDNNCQDTQFYNYETSACEDCTNNCLKCIQNNKNQYCFSCKPGYALTNGQCSSTCGPSQYRAKDGTCKNCPDHCKACQLSNDQVQCTLCEKTYDLTSSHTCVKCTSNQYIDEQGKCQNCPDHCSTCTYNTAVHTVQCNSCENNYQINSKVLCQQCASNKYFNKDDECLNCPQHCTKCGLNNAKVLCTACETSYELNNNSVCIEFSYILQSISFLGIILFALLY